MNQAMKWLSGKYTFSSWDDFIIQAMKVAQCMVIKVGVQ